MEQESSMDQKFIRILINAIEANLDNEYFGTDELAKEVTLSRSQLYRKLISITNQSPSQFISTIRLKRAALLLRQRAGTVSEIAYRVGFSNPPYFHRCFREQFGVTPAEYQKSN